MEGWGAGVADPGRPGTDPEHGSDDLGTALGSQLFTHIKQKFAARQVSRASDPGSGSAPGRPGSATGGRQPPPKK
jgi:hypothetical protein